MNIIIYSLKYVHNVFTIGKVKCLSSSLST